MTAGWGGVRLAASRGGGWPLGGEGKVWQRAGWVEDYCWAVMGIQDDQNCYFSMHTEDTLYNNNLVKFKPTEALSWKDKTEIKYYIFKTKKYCCAVVLHYCHSIINKIKNSVRRYVHTVVHTRNLSNWNAVILGKVADYDVIFGWGLLPAGVEDDRSAERGEFDRQQCERVSALKQDLIVENLRRVTRNGDDAGKMLKKHRSEEWRGDKNMRRTKHWTVLLTPRKQRYKAFTTVQITEC